MLARWFYRVSLLNNVTTTLSGRRLASFNHGISPQHFDRLLVLDFEATCDKNNNAIQPQVENFSFFRVLEKNMVLISADVYLALENCRRLLSFQCWLWRPRALRWWANIIAMSSQRFTPPWLHSAPNWQGLFRCLTVLSGCTFNHLQSLMAILFPFLLPMLITNNNNKKEMVEEEEPLEMVLADFHQWLTRENLLKQKFAFVTCGDWDLRQLLPRQCLHTGLNIPAYFKSWINIKMVRIAAPFLFFPSPFSLYTMHAMTWNKNRYHMGRVHCLDFRRVDWSLPS